MIFNMTFEDLFMFTAVNYSFHITRRINDSINLETTRNINVIEERQIWEEFSTNVSLHLHKGSVNVQG